MRCLLSSHGDLLVFPDVLVGRFRVSLVGTGDVYGEMAGGVQGSLHSVWGLLSVCSGNFQQTL